MKQLLKLFTLAMLLCCGVMSSEAATVTFNIADPNAVSMTLNQNGVLSVLTPVKGNNVITYDASVWSVINIIAKDGYQIASVKANGAYDDILVSGSTNATAMLSSETNGRSYTVNTINLELARTSSLTVKVTDDFVPGKLAIRRGYDEISITTNPQVIKFNPTTESAMQLHRSDYNRICSTFLNETPVEGGLGGVYNFSAVDGDVLSVMVEYPADLMVPLAIKYPEGMKSIISKVTINNQENDEWDTPDFKVKAGTEVYVYLDSRNMLYQYDGATINGVPQNMYGIINTIVGVDPVEIKLLAHAYEIYDVTLNIDEPSRMFFYVGQYSQDPITFTENVAHVSVSEADPWFKFNILDDYQIVAVTDANGDYIDYDEHQRSIKITGNTEINFDTMEKPYDAAFTVYLNTLEGVTYAQYIDQNLRKYIDLHEGYNVIKYVSDYPGQYVIQTYGDEGVECVVYKDDILEPDYGRPTIYQTQIIPEDGMVIKIFYGGEPEKHNVKVTVDEEIENSVEVYADKVQRRWDFDEMSLHAGSHVAVKSADNTPLKVTVDNETITPEADGNYGLYVSAAHEIKVERGEESAINTIVATEQGSAVYNLYGVKVAATAAEANALPAGIYVVKGKKVVVK